jgi:iron(III) transport system substrate-binding protein
MTQVLVYLVLLVGFLNGMAFGAESDAQRALVEGAKKEGRMMFYTSVETEFARVLTSGFEAKYPFIKTDVFRSSHDKIFSRLNMERKAGSFAADVLSVGEFETYHMKKRGLLAPYMSPHAAVYPEGFKDPDGYWTDFYDNLIVSAYNTTKVKREELPKRYEDLLQPRWRRRMVLDKNEDRWFANMLHHMGEKKGMEFMQALAKQEVAIRSGRSLITQLMAAGEFDLQIVAYWYRPHLMKKQGAPVDWFSLDPAFVAMHPISLIDRAPNMNAGKLFIDYVLSEEGQRLFAKRGREPARPGIRPEGYPSQIKVIPSRVELAEKLADYTRRYESLFVR